MVKSGLEFFFIEIPLKAFIGATDLLHGIFALNYKFSNKKDYVCI
jgi:hypothetical protein